MEIIREKSRSGMETFFIQVDNKKVSLYSKYDPQKDVIRDLKNHEYKENSVYILMGTGVYHLKELLINVKENSEIILFDTLASLSPSSGKLSELTMQKLFLP